MTAAPRPPRPSAPARRPRSLRSIRAAVLVSVTALALTACGGGGSSPGAASSSAPPADPGAPVTLTFVNAQDPGTFDKVIAGFTKENPNVTIKLQTLPFDDLNTTVQSRLGSKDASIDLYDVDEPRLASFALRGYLADLGDLRTEGEGVIDPKALEATTYDGKQYAMPRWTSTQLLYYNKALVEKSGVAAPSSDPTKPATWESVTEAGKAAQKAGARYGMTFEQVDRYYQLQPLAESAGGGSGLTGEGLLTPDVTNPGWVKAFSWYKSTFDDEVAPRGVSPEQTATLFADGDTAFFAGGPWNAPLFDEAEVDYGVAPFPTFAGGKPVSSTGSWATGASPFSAHPEEAKAFIRYMTVNPTGAWEASSRNIPVQEEAFEKYLADAAKGGGSAADLAEIIRHELASNAVARPTSVGFVDFEAVMNKAFADIRNGTDPTARLQQATEELDRVLAKYK